VADQDQDAGGAKPPEPPAPEGARPDGQADDRRDAGDDQHGDDTHLREQGTKALERERAARREADQRAAALERRLQELEDAGKSEVERAIARLDRQSAELDAERTARAELEQRLADRDLLELKREVANEVGIPFEAAHRLQGTDVRSIRTDAQRYLEERKNVVQGDLGVGRGGTAAGRGAGTDMNQLIREASGRS
jgi:hypothetical protein